MFYYYLTAVFCVRMHCLQLVRCCVIAAGSAGPRDVHIVTRFWRVMLAVARTVRTISRHKTLRRICQYTSCSTALLSPCLTYIRFYSMISLCYDLQKKQNGSNDLSLRIYATIPKRNINPYFMAEHILH